jgi:hypothetical protein
MNIITVFYKEDYGNLLYQAKSLAKNWQGAKEWIIVPEDGNDSKQFVIDNILEIMKGWNVIITDTLVTPTKSGWWRQQILKLWAASEVSQSEYSLILDAKNFLINPIDGSWFFVDGAQRVRIFRIGPNIDREPMDCWKMCCEYFGSDPYEKIEGWTLTPWVWRKDLVKLTINEYAKRGHDIYNTEYDLPAWEFNAYWWFAQDLIKWVHMDMGEGIFEERNSNGELIDFHTEENVLPFYKTMPFWSFHRRMKNNPTLVDINHQLLKDKDIIDDLDIKKWKMLNGV